MPKKVTKKSPRIKVRDGLSPKAKWKYPFDDLKQEGNYFIVEGSELENSVRAQASKNQVSRWVKYTVNRVTAGQVLSDGTRIKKDGVVVRFEHYL